MAELADALDLGSSGRPCRFDSCYPQEKRRILLRRFFIKKIHQLVITEEVPNNSKEELL